MKTTIVFQISATNIKCMRVSGEKNIINIFDVINITQMTDDVVVSLLEDWIKRKQISFRNTRVILVLPRSLAILRQLILPAQDLKELRAMIDLQAVNHMPYAREEVEIDFQVLEKRNDGYSKLLVVVIPREEVMRYWNIFNQARIPLDFITISSVGIWLWYRHLQKSHEVAALIDFDSQHSEICFSQPEGCLTSREIPLGFKQLLESGSEEFLSQWELTLNSALKEKMITSVQIVYLLSSSGQTATLASSLSGDFIVKEVNPLQGLTMTKNNILSQTLLAEGTSLVALLGMTMHQGDVPINLIPATIKEAELQQSRQREWIVFGFWAVAAGAALILALTVGSIKQNALLIKLDKQLSVAKKEASNIEARLKQVENIEDLLSQRIIFADMVEEIYQLLPVQTSLISLSVSDGRVLSLQGFSLRAGDINQMQANMVNSTFFTNVNLEYVNKRVTQEEEVNYFKISAVIKKNGETNEKIK